MCDSQFSFNLKHSTKLYIYILYTKALIDYCKHRITTIFVTFLDANKAFDNIIFGLLLRRLFNFSIDFSSTDISFPRYLFGDSYVFHCWKKLTNCQCCGITETLPIDINL